MATTIYQDGGRRRKRRAQPNLSPAPLFEPPASAPLDPEGEVRGLSAAEAAVLAFYRERSDGGAPVSPSNAELSLATSLREPVVAAARTSLHRAGLLEISRPLGGRVLARPAVWETMPDDVPMSIADRVAHLGQLMDGLQADIALAGRLAEEQGDETLATRAAGAVEYLGRALVDLAGEDRQ